MHYAASLPPNTLHSLCYPTPLLYHAWPPTHTPIMPSHPSMPAPPRTHTRSPSPPTCLPPPPRSMALCWLFSGQPDPGGGCALRTGVLAAALPPSYLNPISTDLPPITHSVAPPPLPCPQSPIFAPTPPPSNWYRPPIPGPNHPLSPPHPCPALTTPNGPRPPPTHPQCPAPTPPATRTLTLRCAPDPTDPPSPSGVHLTPLTHPPVGAHLPPGPALHVLVGDADSRGPATPGRCP